MADAHLPVGDVIGLAVIGGARLGKLAFGANRYARIFYKANPQFKKYIGRGIMEVHHRIPQRYIDTEFFPESMRASLSN